LACRRCGFRFSLDERTCVVCGNKDLPIPTVRDPVAPSRAVSLRDDTVSLPGLVNGDLEERVVRPTLAVLFRLAVGPAADYYTPRFLSYEGAGHGAPGWHWPALLLQSVWAFYRKLWLPGIFYALLPAAGALAFLRFAQNLDDWSVPWLLCAAVAIWLVPGIIAAVLSTPLLYGRVRRVVRRAERIAGDPAKAAALLASRRSTSLFAALIFGVGALIVSLSPVAPRMLAAYAEHAVRAQIAASLSALSPLKREVEEQWLSLATMPRPFADAAMAARRWTQFLDDVSISPITGRLRIGLGPSIPELWGKTILLAPATDWLQRIHWTCIPVDIPRNYLPKECREGTK
jgi:Pilin (bacterial filament)